MMSEEFVVVIIAHVLMIVVYQMATTHPVLMNVAYQMVIIVAVLTVPERQMVMLR